MTARRGSLAFLQVLLGACLTTVFYFLLTLRTTSTQGSLDFHEPARNNFSSLFKDRGTLEKPKSKYAYVVYLAPSSKEDAGEEDDGEHNPYMISTRMLIYQTQHDPETRTNNSIPIVVLVSPGVSQVKRKQLEAEGAWVAEFPSIELDTVKAGRARWKHVMDKMNVFRLTQFEKVLLMDSDIVLFKPLDAIFEEPETDIQTNIGMTDQTKDDEGTQPRQYLLAADSSPYGSDKHPWPAPRSKALNAGFMVLHPSEEMLKHYLTVGAIEGRTPMRAPENNLLEYVHRPNGNMPYSQLRHYWVMNHPVYSDYENGIAAVHEKWFRNSQTDLKLKSLLTRVRWKMEGYWGH
jgi:alpha-N-acetylglucosamine transferase